MTTTLQPNRTPQLGYTALPLELHNQQQWVLWNDDAGWPQAYMAKGKRADCYHPEDLATLDSVALHLMEMPNHGIAFWLSRKDPYAVIYVKDCRDAKSGEIADWARPILDEFSTYAEINESGTGIKLWTKAMLPGLHPGLRFKVGEGAVAIVGGWCCVTVTGCPVDLKTGKLVTVPQYCEVAPSNEAVLKWWNHFTASEDEFLGEFIGSSPIELWGDPSHMEFDASFV
ncbi:hypothetical protein [Aeoliella sp.]|uniref:hypothetical protein n=1 Tax=Aeoliella sp. TaxID=2795800 RepID=UPI003CCBC5B1